MIRMAALAALTLALTGCGDRQAEQRQLRIEQQQLRIEQSVTTWRDEARGVTCWLYMPVHGGGISCLPDHPLQATPSANARQGFQPQGSIEEILNTENPGFKPQAHHPQASPEATEHQAFNLAKRYFSNDTHHRF